MSGPRLAGRPVSVDRDVRSPSPATRPIRCGPLFVPDGRRLVPTERARGPWSPDALHGGPVAALVARAAETVPGGEELQLVRITLELLRPVPMAPLAVTSVLAKAWSHGCSWSTR